MIRSFPVSELNVVQLLLRLGGCSVIFNYAHKPDHCSQRRGRLRDKARGSIGEDQECDAPLPHVLGDDYNPSRYLDCLKSARREQETLQI